MNETRIRPWAVWAGLLLAAQGGHAAVAWDESVSGDLSGAGLSPTALTLLPGSNLVLGSTGRNPSTDRDYFSITVAAGQLLSAVNLLPGTAPLGVSFIGLQSGPQVTVATNPASAAGLLGWWHFGTADIGQDLLPLMAVSSNGSSGFSPPLGAGAYAFWVQDFGQGVAPYRLDLVIGAVPEPTSAALWLAGVAGLLAWRRQAANRSQR